MKKGYVITLVVICLLLVGSIFLGTSYSLWQRTAVQEGTNEIQVGCFRVTFTNLASYQGQTAGDINLVNTYPLRDEDGASLTPYMFNIKNECSVASDYIINLETLNTSDFNTDYLRVKFNDVNNVTSNTSSIYTSLDEGIITLTNEANAARVLGTGHLEQDETATYSLRVWIDKDATTSTPNVMGRTWRGKVVVTSEAAAPKETAVKYLEELESDELVKDDTEDENLRYIGANPNNYVSFNNELWRIIGVMNNIETEDGQTKSLLKIIRNESLGEYSWDTSSGNDRGGECKGINCGSGVNEWSQADLMQELNNDYLGNVTVGTDGYWYNGTDNSKTANMPTTTLGNESQNKIESVVWKLGSPNNDNGTYVDCYTSVFTTPYVYTHERSNTNGKICTSGGYCNDSVTRTPSWTGKVALMYPSDYGYATAGGNTTNRQTCLGLGLNNGWGNSSYANCRDNDWLKPDTRAIWTLSPYTHSLNANFVFLLGSGGNVNGNYTGVLGVQPVVFLKSNVLITGGSGTSTDPYILG